MTKDERFVILASSLGTVFEWYDFYLFGSLASVIGAQFFGVIDPVTKAPMFNQATRDIFALLAFGLREPLRGSAESTGIAVKKTLDAGVGQFLQLLRIPTLRATIFAQTILFFVLASNAFWLPIVLNRRFDLSVSKAGLLAGVVLVGGGLIGTLAGGAIYFGGLAVLRVDELSSLLALVPRAARRRPRV